MADDPIARLDERNRRALDGGGPARIAKHHAAGKLTARERITLLLDDGSFDEIDRLVLPRGTARGEERERIACDAVITGVGHIDGRPVAVYAQDFTVVGGTLSAAHAAKICKTMDTAMRLRIPIIGLNDSGGGRIQDGVQSLAGYGDIFLRNTLASGVVPQISGILGPCAGGAVYSPAITDFVLMVEHRSYMFITGPDVIRAVTNEEVTKEELGGHAVHAAKSGVCHLTAPDDAALLAQIRELMGYLPLHNGEDPPRAPFSGSVDAPIEALDAAVPPNPRAPYDMKSVVRAVLDGEALFEIHEAFAPNIVVGFGRLGGRVVGVVANQPDVLAGCLDIEASRKAARFVRFCDCFNVPLLTFVDVPGFLPGVGQEHGGIITHGAQLLYAFAEATVPKITIIVRKAYGGAYDVMASKHIRADYNIAFPTGEIAVMGAEAAVRVIHRRELDVAPDPAAAEARFVDDYRTRHAHPYRAAEFGFIDEVLYPRHLRRRLAQLLAMLEDKADRNPPRKHGNIPI